MIIFIIISNIITREYMKFTLRLQTKVPQSSQYTIFFVLTFAPVFILIHVKLFSYLLQFSVLRHNDKSVLHARIIAASSLT